MGSNTQETEQEASSNPQAELPDSVINAENGQTINTGNNFSIAFVENVGQFDPRARFQAQSNDANMYFSEDAIWFTLLEPPVKDPNEDHPRAILDGLVEEQQKPRKGVNLKVNLMGSNPHPTIESFNRVATSFSYFTGSDPSNWHSDVPAWGGIRYVDIYPGMDLKITSEENRLLWHFLVTDASRFYDKNNPVAQQDIRIKIAGHQRLQTRNNTLDIATDVGTLSLPMIRVNDVELLPEVDKNGDLIIPLPTQTSISLGNFKTVRYTIPTSTRLDVSPSRQPVSSTQTLNNANTYGLSSDNVLIYSAYFGSSYTTGDALALDSDNAVYITGSVGSTGFPLGTGVFYVSEGTYDTYIAKIDLDTSQVIYTAFFKKRGSCGNWSGGSIAVDSNKNVYVAGTTTSADFPTTDGVIDRQFTDICPPGDLNGDGFILKLNATGNQLLYSTYLGGNNKDLVTGIIISEDGSAYVAGRTYSADIPKGEGTPGYSQTLNGPSDVFITKLSPAADQQEFFTYVGGSSLEDTFGNLKVGNDGSIYLAGVTTSSDFPTTADAYIPSYSNSGLCTYTNCYNAFALKLDSIAGDLIYATYLGEVGTGYAVDLDIDEAGHAYIGGWARFANFPHISLIGAGSLSLNGNADGFTVKLSPDGKNAVYSTLIGGTKFDAVWAISVDNNGNSYLVGESSSDDFPISPAALDTSVEEYGQDLIFVKLDSSGNQLTYGTFLGGSDWDYMSYQGVPIDSAGNINILVRYTDSTDFPTTHPSIGNDGNAVIVRLSTGLPIYDCAIDTFEPDNTLATGSPITIGEIQRHTLCPQNDEDWANFQVPPTLHMHRNYLVETFDLEPDDINPNGDTQLTVTDESGNRIGTNQFRGFGPFPGSPDRLQSSRVVWHPAADGIFNIRIFPEKPINEQEGSGYSLRLVDSSVEVDPVDQGSWSPTKVMVPLVWRSGNLIYFFQYFTYEQAELDALNAVPATLAWEFRRPEVDIDTGLEIDETNVDYGDYWRSVDGVCVGGEYWTNLPNHSDRFVEETNWFRIPGCEPNNPLAPQNEEFELYVDNTNELVANKVYYIVIKFHIHDEYLNSDYQFYISKAEYCELYLGRFDVVCNIRYPDLAIKRIANLIEGYLQPAS